MSKKQMYICNTLIIFLIGLILLGMNYFVNSKFKEMEISSKEAMLLNDNLTIASKEDLSKYMKIYRPDAYKRIEIYDENFNSTFSIILDDYSTPMNLKEHPELIQELQSKEEGQSTFKQNDYEANVYFKWNTDSDGKRLYIIYTRRSIIKYLYIYNFLSCGVMCLIFVFFLINHFNLYKMNQSHYSNLINEI